MKKITLLTLTISLFVLNSYEQILVKVNDKLLTENQTIDAKDIKKIDLSLAKAVKLKANSVGKARLYVELSGTDNKIIEGYTIEKVSVNSVEVFLKDSKTTYVLYQEGGENKTFQFTLNAPPTLKAVLEQAATNPINKLVKVSVSLMFSDKTIDAYGVEHYGVIYDLIPVFQFNIKNESLDGSITLLEIGANFSGTVAKQINYKSQDKFKSFFYDKVNPLFTSNDVIKCHLKGTKSNLQILFNQIDIKDKTQDEYLNELNKSLSSYLLAISNLCNKNIS
jgi:hypothetical protein